MLTHRFFKLAFPIALSSTLGCTQAAEQESASYSIEESRSAPRAFCSIAEQSTPRESTPYRSTFWGYDTVQREVAAVRSSDEFRCSPHSAYVAAYERMTSARDVARCAPASPMSPKDPLDARLNDALSDLMTRNYLQIVEACVQEPDAELSPSADVGGLWCDLHRTAERDNWDSVRVAMGSTGLYLSAHLALATSALPHIDNLWAGTGLDTIPERVERLRRFKPTYDGFNKFLGQSLGTVSRALSDAGLTWGFSLDVSSGVAQSLLPSELVFGKIRDDAFKAALEIALATPEGTHPWTEPGPSGAMLMASSVVDAPDWADDPELQSKVEGLTAMARRVRGRLANPLLRVLGGHTFRELTPGSRTHAECMARSASF